MQPRADITSPMSRRALAVAIQDIASLIVEGKLDCPTNRQRSSYSLFAVMPVQSIERRLAKAESLQLVEKELHKLFPVYFEQPKPKPKRKFAGIQIRFNFRQVQT